MVGKRVQFDDATWQALTMLTFQEIADEAFANLLHKHDRPVDLKDAAGTPAWRQGLGRTIKRALWIAVRLAYAPRSSIALKSVRARCASILAASDTSPMPK
jgi:hypothetical protein